MLATSISSIFLNKKVWTPVLQSLHLLLACLNLNLWTLETPGEACLSHWRMRRQKKGELLQGSSFSTGVSVNSCAYFGLHQQDTGALHIHSGLYLHSTQGKEGKTILSL
ncbi:hypothetical protein Y1Q_0008742 [Alligator mississippiensis]|uniref:Uncharacterized protein n=1 Tax=Alligator mississippiensis TaxID=8496 RepID=A0A151N9T9_ALLMI|nr:hypothetical protein Y1Q_0008742 [Alligator mississippiensis]